MTKIFSLFLVIGFLAFGCADKYNTKEDLYAEGMRLINANNSGSAIIFFKNALEKDQNYFDARVQLAKTYSSVGKFDLAEKEFQKVLRQRPASREVRIEITKVYLQTSRPDDALKAIGSYITDACNDVDILEDAGLAYALKGNYNTAIALLKRANSIDNAKPSSQLALAKVYMMMGNVQEAGLQLTGILKKDPSSKDALYMLAELQIRQNETKAAINTYEQILLHNPAEGEAFFRKGMLYVKSQNYDEALSLSDSFIRKFPKKYEAYQLKGISLFYKKNFNDAIAVLQKSISLQPSISVYFYLGLCHYYKNELEQAMSHLQKVLEVNPSFAQARILISLIHLKKNRIDNAIHEIKKALEGNEQDSLAHNILGSAYMAKKMYSEGMDELNKALEIDPNLADVYVKKGIFALSNGRVEAGELELNTAIRINPELLYARVLLAFQHTKRMEYDKAIQFLTQGLKGQKTDASFYTMIAEVLLRQNKVNEAVRNLQKAKVADPSYEASYFDLASIHFFKNEYDKGIQELKYLLESSPDNVKALITIASLLEAKGNDGEALRYYARAKDTGKPEGYIETAKYHLRKKEPDAALAILDETIKKYPNDTSPYELKGRTLLSEKKFAAAVKTFEDMEKINTNMGLTYVVNAYILMEKPDKAMEKIRKEMKKSPERLDLAAEVSRIYTIMGKKQDAIESANQIIREHPDSPVGYMTLAMTFKEGADLEKGIEVLKNASRINDANLRMMLGSLYLLKKDYSLALDQYRKAEQIKPGYVPAIFQKGSILHLMGKKEEAIAEYGKVLRLSRNHVGTLNNIAYLYAEGNRNLPAALQLATRAFMLAPHDGSIQDTLGFVLLKSGKVDEAVTVLRKAAGNIPNNPSVYYHLALAYNEQRNNALAIENYYKAISLGDFPEAEHAKILLAKLNGSKANASK